MLMLTVVDEHTRKCLAIKMERRLNIHDVLNVLGDLFVTEGLPDHIRSDNGSEFTAKIPRKWLHDLGVKTSYINLSSPWENGYNESFNGRLTDELLKGELFYSLKEAQVIIGQWRDHYNHVRPPFLSRIQTASARRSSMCRAGHRYASCIPAHG